MKGFNIYLDEGRTVTVTLYEPRHLKLTHPGEVWTNPRLQGVAKVNKVTDTIQDLEGECIQLLKSKSKNKHKN